MTVSGQADYSNYIVLLARQRSGTHALRSFLGAHPEVFCIDEIFHLRGAEDPGTGATNYFAFLKEHTRTDPLRLLPVDHEPLFLAYLDGLRRFTDKRFILLDVKYNSTHHLSRNYQPMAAPPYLFEVIQKSGLRTFWLTRKNYLRYFVSLVKARRSGQFVARSGEARRSDAKIPLLIPEMLMELNRCRAEDELVRHSFTELASYLGYEYAPKLFTWDYANLFPDSGQALAPDFQQRFCDWLGIAPEFQAQCEFRKQSSLSLPATIENFEDVARALRGTAFEACLADEPSYSRKNQSHGTGNPVSSRGLVRAARELVMRTFLG